MNLLKIIKCVNLFTIAMFASINLSTTAQASRSLATQQKKKLAQYQLTKKQTYGEFWLKARKEFPPKMQAKLDQWMWSMRNELMPEITYSTFRDQNGEEKLRVHFTENNRTNTLAIFANSTKAMTYNNTTIEPEELSHIDHVITKILAEDEKIGREALKAPSLVAKPNASSPNTLTADEFFKLSRQDKLSYIRKMTSALAAAENVQAVQLQIKNETDNINSEKKPQNAGAWLNIFRFVTGEQARAEDELEDFRTNDKLAQDREELNKAFQTYQSALENGDTKQSTTAKENYEKTAANFSTNHRFYRNVVTKQQQQINRSLVEYSRKTQQRALQDKEDAFNKEIRSVNYADQSLGFGQLKNRDTLTDDNYMQSESELRETYKNDNTICFSGGFLGRIEFDKTRKTYACHQLNQQVDGTINNSSFNVIKIKNNESIKVEVKCPQNQAACSPLLFGLQDNKNYCVDLGAGKSRNNSVTQMCMETSANKSTDDVLKSIFGEEMLSEACMKDRLCYEKARLRFERWNHEFEHLLAKQNIACEKFKNSNFASGTVKNRAAIEILRKDQAATCTVLKKRTDELSKFAFPAFKSTPKLAGCAGLDATSVTENGQSETTATDRFCRCKNGEFANKVLSFDKAHDYCKLEKTVATGAANGANAIACDNVTVQPGWWERHLNPFWRKREKYTLAKEQCPYAWSNKRDTTGAVTATTVAVLAGAAGDTPITDDEEGIRYLQNAPPTTPPQKTGNSGSAN